MKILQTYRHVLTIAFGQDEWTKTSIKSVLPLAYMFSSCILCFCVVLFENGTLQMYSEIFYILTTVGSNTIGGGIVYLKRSKISAFIDKIDCRIKESMIQKNFNCFNNKFIYN